MRRLVMSQIYVAGEMANRPYWGTSLST